MVISVLQRQQATMQKTSPLMFCDITIKKRLKICGKKRKQSALAGDISGFLQYIFSLAFYDKNTFALKINDVRKNNDSFEVYVQNEWYKIPQFFNKEIELYLFQYRDVLEPKVDD
eukprot:TRINITY_DN3715_c0_g1_i5.p2 TRINITY_DN3715_c0_g1~~TRINITY_DN3715_c0_g1_i5.p2  ORF type:complete len:115 (+),score=9.97 TRINITY_DN3715_c0_g1_i5:216-560(+)